MAEPKRIDYKKIENFLKNSMDKPQWESNMKAMQSFEAKVQSTQVELRGNDVTKESVAELLPNRFDYLARWEKLVVANKALLKAKYQPEWSDFTNDKLSRYHNALNKLEEESEKIGQMLTLMRSLKDERQLKKFLQL